MSLYIFSKKQTLPPLKTPMGLHIEESSSLMTLATMAGTSQEEVIKRLYNDHVAFIAYIDRVPAAFGWMAIGKAFIGELNQDLVLPVANRYLWNFRTLEQFRGMGIYPILLQHIIRFEQERADTFWIIHAPENTSSLKGIQKAGFEFAGKLYSREGTTTIEATPKSLSLKTQLEEMDITISMDDPASCWNCSSPYLKKRMNECCCTKRQMRCVGNHSFAIAP